MLRTSKMKLVELMILKQDIDRVLEYLGKNANFQIQNETDFSGFYGGLALKEEALKSAPLGYEKDHPHIEKLRMKSFVVIKKLSNKEVMESDMKKLVEDSFLMIKPMIDYLNMAIE